MVAAFCGGFGKTTPATTDFQQAFTSGQPRQDAGVFTVLGLF